jgi:hypothetical protein
MPRREVAKGRHYGFWHILRNGYAAETVPGSVAEGLLRPLPGADARLASGREAGPGV